MSNIGRPKRGTSRNIMVSCHHCGIKFTIPLSFKKFEKSFCSQKCYGKSKRGIPVLSKEQYELNRINFIADNNPNWKGGKEYNLEMAKRWRRKNKDSINQRNANRRALIKGSVGHFSLGDWIHLKEIYNYTCQMCGLCDSEITLTRDHIIPISKGGHNMIGNIQPLCRGCNSSKRDKIMRWAVSEYQIYIPAAGEYL